MHYLNKLFEIEDAYCVSDECLHTQFMAMKEVFEFHYENNEIYRKICDDAGFGPPDLKTPEDVRYIPHLMVNVLKWHTLQTLPDDQIAFEFTSSGTSGQKSHVLCDAASKERQNIMRERIVKAVGIPSDTPVNYIVFSYDPAIAGNRGAAYTHNMYTTFAPAKNKFFAIHADARGMAEFDAEGVLKRLEDYAKDKGTPVRFVGFPAFMHEIALLMKEKGTSFDFNHKDSMVITGGGWKDKEEKSIPFEAFKREINETVGIPMDNFRDLYGFVEHGVPYLTCSQGHFHVPIFARAYVRKPGNLEFLDYNEKGLLHLLSPYNLAQPTISILSTDYAELRTDCACGIQTPYIKLSGRAGKQKHKGCAITAAELLKA